MLSNIETIRTYLISLKENVSAFLTLQFTDETCILLRHRADVNLSEGVRKNDGSHKYMECD